MATKRICSIPECDKPHEARGWCNAHYKRFLKNGDPSPDVALATPKGDPMFFIENVALNHNSDECLIWPYSRNSDGYGVARWEGNTRIVSRVVCELAHGSPPTPKHEAAHSCGNGHVGCVSPPHLLWKSAKGNAEDREKHGRTAFGLRNARAKLNSEIIAIIRTVKDVTQAEIAKVHGVTQSQISRIRSGDRQRLPR